MIEKLKLKFDKIQNTLYEIEVAKSNIKFYFDAIKEFKEITENSDFFYNSFFFTNKVLFINLYILLDKDEYFSFPKIFNFLESNRK